MDRVLVVGTTGSGKTTTARRLAELIGAPHVELDALFWKPGWTERKTEDFRARVAAATTGDRWVTDGNYLGRLGDLLWERADTVVFLDIPLMVVVPRLVRRTIARSLRRTDLWATGNRERIANLWNKDESLVAWALRTKAEHLATYSARMADPRWTDIDFVVLRSPREVGRWLTEAAGRHSR